MQVITVDQKADIIKLTDNSTLNLKISNTQEVLPEIFLKAEFNDDPNLVVNTIENKTVPLMSAERETPPTIDITGDTLMSEIFVKAEFNDDSSLVVDTAELAAEDKTVSLVSGEREALPTIDITGDTEMDDNQLLDCVEKFCYSSSSSQQKNIEVNLRPSLINVEKERSCNVVKDETHELFNHVNDILHECRSMSPQKQHKNLEKLTHHPVIQDTAKQILDLMNSEETSCDSELDEKMLERSRMYPQTIATKVINNIPSKVPKHSNQKKYCTDAYEEYCAETTILVDCLMDMKVARRAQILSKMVGIGKKYNSSE